MSPDFPYLIHLAPTHAPGHTVWGVFLYCLLPSLLIVLSWFKWLQKPTLSFWHLQDKTDAASQPHIPLIITGILIGAFTHIAWDATSHSFGYFVQGSELLNTEIVSRPIYKWNQYLSGVIGLTILGLWYLQKLTKQKQLQTPYKGHLALGMSIYAACIASVTALAYTIHRPVTAEALAVTISIGFMSGGALALVIYAAIYQGFSND